MSRMTYLLSRLGKMDYRAMLETARLLEKKSGKPRLVLMLDMMLCAFRYNAGYIDYKIARMYTLNHAQRKTQITRGISNTIVARMNDKAYWHHFDDKAAFNALFARYIPRKWMKIDADTPPESFSLFLADLDSLIVKPLEGSSGQGIERFSRADWEKNLPTFLARITASGGCIAEEIVQQHAALAALCPTSVNTIRIATLLGDKQQGIVYAFLRIGNGKVMDNVDCGGMAVMVDIETGTLLTVGADKQGNTYEKHPMTGVPIIGFTIPHWEEAKRICLEAAQVVPQMRYIAWDVAITAEGPTFIEGNSFPSHAIPQFADHYPDGIGILPAFEKFITL